MGKNFKDFKISEDVLKALDRLSYKKPSEVQVKVIPRVLEDRDIIVKSQTGSGKTASFGIPLCEKVDWDENKAQALILTPTRELAVQVKEDISNIGRFKRIRCVAVFGKQPFSEQTRELKQKTHIVAGTPGRVLDHIDRGTLDVSKINYLVIDEADEMLNMGFIDQVETLIQKLPTNRITMLFSATIPEEIESLCDKYMKGPEKIEIESQSIVNKNIEHKIFTVNYKEKLDVLRNILVSEVPDTAVIFCKTKENTDMVFNYLNNKKYLANKIHGGMLQKDRLQTMDDFRNGKFRILVATDVAARGIDIEGITHVINFDIPMEKEAYVHRIGRTGRAGAKGKAITLKTEFEDKFLLAIEEYVGLKIEDYILAEKSLILNNLDEATKVLSSRPKMKEKKFKNVSKDITKIYLNGGKKKKIRAGDIVGAISRITGITAEDIGVIDVQDTVSYVDILNGKGKKVVDELKNMTIKGKNLKVEMARK